MVAAPRDGHWERLADSLSGEVLSFAHVCVRYIHWLFLFFLFLFIFLMWTVFKVFIEFVTLLLLLYVLVFWP